MSEDKLASIFNKRMKPARVQEERRMHESRPPVDKSVLGLEQGTVFDRMEEGDESLFITGRAGTGKSFLLDFFVKNTRKKVAVVAPTGVAAMNVGGQTIHSFFRIPPKTPVSKEGLEQTIYGRRKELYCAVETIVIDEISMVRSDVLDVVDYILRVANENNLPFGGKQMLMFGDLYQLPPVAKPQVHRYLDDVYGGVFFFNTPGIRELSPKTVELRHVFRQGDSDFVRVLDGVRDGTITSNDLSLLNSRAVPMERKPAILIAPTRDIVDSINEAALESLHSELFTYEAAIEGDSTEDSFPAPKELKLKVGARVMLLKNDSGGKQTTGRVHEKPRWVNGTIGQVARLEPDSIHVMVEGVRHQLDRTIWTRSRYQYDPRSKKLDSVPVTRFTQYPVTLGWAMTIHKAQGATYQTVGVDLGDGMFAPGQLYVALSRCTTLDHLYLTRPVTREDIQVSEEVRDYMRKATH